MDEAFFAAVSPRGLARLQHCGRSSTLPPLPLAAPPRPPLRGRRGPYHLPLRQLHLPDRESPAHHQRLAGQAVSTGVRLFHTADGAWMLGGDSKSDPVLSVFVVGRGRRSSLPVLLCVLLSAPPCVSFLLRTCLCLVTVLSSSSYTRCVSFPSPLLPSFLPLLKVTQCGGIG